MELNPYLSPCTGVNSRWIKDLEVRPESVKLLEEGIGSTLHHIGTGRNFLNKTSKAQEIKTRINKWIALNYRASAHQRKPSRA